MLQAHDLAYELDPLVGPLFTGVTLSLDRGDKVALVGPNGAGKTTLMRGLLDPETLDGGQVVWGRGAVPAMLTQTRTSLDPAKSAVDQVDGIRPILGALNLRGDLPRRPIGTLSVGERTRVELAVMLLAGANVLLLDEPTNHLDLPSREALESALREYKGAVVFTSHDRRFVDDFAEEVQNL